VVWQATVETERDDPALSACSRLYDGAIADSEVTAYSADARRLASDGLVRYSGVLALKAPSRNPRDAIWLGICGPQPVRLRRFRYSTYGWSESGYAISSPGHRLRQ
jgi:hypothetical protein